MMVPIYLPGVIFTFVMIRILIPIAQCYIYHCLDPVYRFLAFFPSLTLARALFGLMGLSLLQSPC